MKKLLALVALLCFAVPLQAGFLDWLTTPAESSTLTSWTAVDLANEAEKNPVVFKEKFEGSEKRIEGGVLDIRDTKLLVNDKEVEGFKIEMYHNRWTLVFYFSRKSDAKRVKKYDDVIIDATLQSIDTESKTMKFFNCRMLVKN